MQLVASRHEQPKQYTNVFVDLPHHQSSELGIGHDNQSMPLWAITTLSSSIFAVSTRIVNSTVVFFNAPKRHDWEDATLDELYSVAQVTPQLQS
jgi:hypothetical protein